MDSSVLKEEIQIKNSIDMGKFKFINYQNLVNILNFITPRENVCIIFEVNKKFVKIICKIFRKDNSISNCLKEIKGLVKGTEEFKFISANHCINLEENLKKFRESYNPFIFNRAVYLLSSLVFREVQSLDLQKNNIGSDGVILLLPLLKKSSVIIHLNLSYNNISDEGCKFLALALKKNSSLQILNLECNGISDGGVISLSEGLVTHRCLKTFKMALNVVTIEGVKFLAAILERSQSPLVVLDFKYNNLVIKDDLLTENLRKLKIHF